MFVMVRYINNSKRKVKAASKIALNVNYKKSRKKTLRISKKHKAAQRQKNVKHIWSLYRGHRVQSIVLH
jgi:hypothetical protein